MTDGETWLWWFVGALLGGCARWMISKAYDRLKPSSPGGALAMEPLAVFLICAAAMWLSWEYGEAHPWAKALVNGGFFIGLIVVNPDPRRDSDGDAFFRMILAIGGGVAGLAAGAYLGR